MKNYFMIPKNKIDEAAYNNTELLRFSHKSMETISMARRLDNSFTAGVSFAEKELENLAIEFAEWILQHKDPSFGIIGGYKCPNKWMDTIQGNRIDYTTEELFEIFKQEKYENTK